jgi:hypothetical protein
MNAPAVQERHAAVLAALGRRSALLRALGFDTSDGTWRRTYGRFNAVAAALATLVFERGDPPEIVVVDVHERRPPDERAVPLPGAEDAAWLVARGIREDARLPTIGAVLDGPGRRTVVRYRPARRCTIRVEEDRAVRYAKVQPSADLAALHRDAETLWAASQDGRLGFAVAPPGGVKEATQSLWQGAIDGLPLKPRLLAPDGVALGAPLGRALGTLHASGVRPAAMLGRWAPLLRARSAGTDLAARVPALEPRVADVLARIEALDRAAGERPARPIHGAPHPAQWLAVGDGLGLVDFDRFALGDPELDLAVLLAEIEDESRAPAGLDHAVLAGYEAVAGPLDPRLLLACRAAGRLATARRHARGIRPDGAVRAAAALGAAVAMLDDGA